MSKLIEQQELVYLNSDRKDARKLGLVDFTQTPFFLNELVCVYQGVNLISVPLLGGREQIGGRERL